MKRIIPIILILLSLSSVSYSEPTPTLQYLINEPVSMLDWGLFQLNNKLNEISVGYDDGKKFKTITLNTIVLYNFEKNTIIINSHPKELYYVIDGKKNAKQLCKDIATNIRATLVISPNPPFESFFSILLIDTLFSHRGYTKSDRPKDTAIELMDIMEIYTSLSYREKDDNMQEKAPQIKCKSPLKSNETYYSE